MNLVIDIGNTLCKTAVFSGNEVVSFSSFENVNSAVLGKLLEANPAVQHIILCAVAEFDKDIPVLLKSKAKLVMLEADTKLPIINLYQTPNSLGKDRLAAVVGVHSLFPAQNALSVDAGTCIKYDFVNAQGQYLGGGISPGIDMRFKALNKFTDQLPLVTYKSYDNLVGGNTEESILSGVMNGVSEEVKGIIARYRAQYPDTKVVFTGGYLQYFERIFNISQSGKSSIFADPFLVLKGLNHILTINVR